MQATQVHRWRAEARKAERASGARGATGSACTKKLLLRERDAGSKGQSCSAVASSSVHGHRTSLAPAFFDTGGFLWNYPWNFPLELFLGTFPEMFLLIFTLELPIITTCYWEDERANTSPGSTAQLRMPLTMLEDP